MALARAYGVNESTVTGPKSAKVKTDLVGLGIVVAAIILFIGTGGSVLSDAIKALNGKGIGASPVLTCALLLNIALLLFGWRRYRELELEVEAQRRAEADARMLAETDELTGCFNRRGLRRATTALIEQAQQRSEAVALLIVDLDNFKQINDIHGHLAGDSMLRNATERFAQVLPNGALLARLGGDEFACVVAYDSATADRVDRLASEIIDAVAKPFVFNEVALEITVSIGIARIEAGRNSVDEQALAHMADIAMYHAKKEGRNRYFWFEPAMESELRFRSELEGAIRRGVSQGEFVPFFEKQVDLASGKVIGFEILARWNSPAYSQVGPDMFIPIAEEIGMIGALSEAVIVQALDSARDWDPSLRLAVNISPVQLRDPWFAQKLLKLLIEANFPPSRLEIEITESCLHDNIGVVRALVHSLKNQGIRISLDDFGTGYSSLAQLRSLPFDQIKIDRSFVTSLPGNPQSAIIVKAIAALGQGLGLPIIAEGVESQAVHDQLLGYGEFLAQGHLFGEPQSAKDVRRDLAACNMIRTALEAEDAGADEAPRIAAGR